MKRVFILLLLILCITTLFADDKPTDLFLGFLSSYNAEKNTVTVIAAYQKLELRVDGVKHADLKKLIIGDLVEFVMYEDDNGYVMASLVNHGMPKDRKEYEAIIGGYDKRRREIHEKKKE